jgi:cyanophycinase
MSVRHLTFILALTVAVAAWPQFKTCQAAETDTASAGGGSSAMDPSGRERWIRERLYQEGIRGTFVICGGGTIPEEGKRKFIEAADPEKPILVLPTASDNPENAIAKAATWLGQLGAKEILTPLPGVIDQGHIADLCDKIQRCGGVWISGGRQARLATAYSGTEVEKAIKTLGERGGVIGGTSAGAAVMTRCMIASGNEQPEMGTGFDLLEDCIVDQHFTERNRLNRLRAAIKDHPERFGLGIDEETAVIVHGRNIDVVGRGEVTIVLAQATIASTAGSESDSRNEVVQKMPSQSRADWTQLRRAARWRAAGIDPGEPIGEVRTVPSGSLVIVGGGGMPKEIVDRFVDLAGGSEARIVVLPTAVPRDEALRQRVPRFLTAAGVKNVTMLPQSRTDEVAEDSFREAIEQATGVWFDGGRQWNFVDAYENTDAISQFHDVLSRGGVIGGSSAGATIQGEYLVRGHPLGNFVMMAEGYERGFGFLPGVAIDQHFAQRNRFPDLLAVVQRHPKMLGIGIDEATAIVVSGSRADVIGQGSAHFVSSNLIGSQTLDPSEDSTVQNSPRRFYRSINSGSSIDLKTLETVIRKPE